MKQTEVIALLHNIVANHQDYTTWTVSTPHLVMLVNKVIEDEREAIAVMVEDWDSDSADPRDIAAAIRARGIKPTSVIYSPGQLAERGLTHEDVVKLIKENK